MLAKFVSELDRQVVSYIYFSKCGHFCGIRCHLGLSISANAPELILPCCPDHNTPSIEVIYSGIRCDFFTALETIFPTPFEVNVIYEGFS